MCKPWGALPRTELSLESACFRRKLCGEVGASLATLLSEGMSAPFRCDERNARNTHLHIETRTFTFIFHITPYQIIEFHTLKLQQGCVAEPRATHASLIWLIFMVFHKWLLSTRATVFTHCSEAI